MLKTRIISYIARNLSSEKTNFETVFSFPQIKYIAIINRLKVYHLWGTGIAVPSCGLMEICNLVPNNIFFSASYIGITGAAVLSLASIPFRNIIGFLYISEDNKLIKISSVDFWGKRKDRIIAANEWIPLFDLPSKVLDGIYYSPQLTDGTKYKLVTKYGTIINATKMSQVLE